MKESTLVFNGQITMRGLQDMIAVEQDVAHAVRELRYNPDKQSLTIESDASAYGPVRRWDHGQTQLREGGQIQK